MATAAPALTERTVVRPGFSGDLSVMPLRDVVVFLGNKRASGVLQFEREANKKKAVISEGRIRSISTTDPREHLGQFLLNLGHLTEDQFEKAFQTQRETKVFLGKILVMTGQLSDQVVREALLLRARETVLEAFRWPDGKFIFMPSGPQAPTDGADLDVDLLDVHREGAFREKAWAKIRAVFPNGAVKLFVDESKISPAPRAGSVDARLVQLIRQGLSVDDLLLSLHATDFFLYQRLYALSVSRAVSVLKADGPGLREDTGPLSAPELMGVSEFEEEIDHLLTAGHVDRAATVVREAATRHPNRDWDGAFVRAQEKHLTELRRELVETGAIPSLKISSQELYTVDVTPPERFLLSRVDGVKTIEAIVRVSPLPELNALTLFRRFIRAGYVDITFGKESG